MQRIVTTIRLKGTAEQREFREWLRGFQQARRERRTRERRQNYLRKFETLTLEQKEQHLQIALGFLINALSKKTVAKGGRAS